MSASKGSAFAAVMKQMSASKGAAFITNENSGRRKINWKKKLRRQERKQVKRMHRKHRSK